jgi:hypothetical protein
MPRLVGKHSDASPMIALLCLLAISAGISLEYLGYINVVPGFGQDIQDISQVKINQAS